MKRLMVGLVLAACGGKAAEPTTATSAVVGNVAEPTPLAELVPTVASRDALMTSEAQPLPLLVIVDDTDELRILKPTDWAALAGTSLSDVRYSDQEHFDQVTREYSALGKPLVTAFDQFPTEWRPTPSPEDSYRAEGQYKMKKSNDDESGGSGTAMALEEGRMGTYVPSHEALPPRALVVAAPDLNAARTIRVLQATDGLLLASYAGEVRPLRIAVVAKSARQLAWDEALLSGQGFHTSNIQTDGVAVGVSGEVTTQRLVDALVDLQGRGVKFVSFTLL